MKVRIKPQMGICDGIKYKLQCKRWWGWETLGETYCLQGCFNWIENLKKIADVEFIKYV